MLSQTLRSMSPCGCGVGEGHAPGHVDAGLSDSWRYKGLPRRGRRASRGGMRVWQVVRGSDTWRQERLTHCGMSKHGGKLGGGKLGPQSK